MPKARSFVAVKTRYEKMIPALAVLDHVMHSRKGYTRSVNVVDEFTPNNTAALPKGCYTAVDALEKACERYKAVTGKKVRSDFNVLFDHVVVLSEEHYSTLEGKLGEKETKKRVMLSMIEYAKQIKKQFGFQPISVQLHLDEGHYENCVGYCKSASKTDCAKDCGRFIRNVHAHVSFFNYDFKQKVAPLRHLMRKGKSANGKTNSLNPNFVRMQDIASDVFSVLNFRRGLSQNITGRQHLSKEKFVKEKLNKAESELSLKQQHINSLQDQLAFSEMKNQRLEKETRKLEEKRGWLKDSIKELQQHLSSLENALRERCQQAIYQIYSKVKNSF